MNKIIAEDVALIARAPLPWKRLAGKTVLITGAAGFLPAYMVETLLHLNDTCSLNCRILGLVRNLERARQRFSQHTGRGDLCLRQGNVAQTHNWTEQIHFIVHAASQASPKFYRTDPVGTICVNSSGTENMLRLAAQQNISGFLFFSSGEVYGSFPARIPTAEKDYGPLDCLDIRSCYGEAKRLGENLCVAFYQQYKVPATIVRPFHTYGPGMRFDDGRIFADFISDVIQHQPLTIKSDGLATRAFCYLRDATAGFFTVLLSGEPGQAYNIGNDQAECSISELAELLVHLFPERNLKVMKCKRLPGDPYISNPSTRSCPDISLARSLGWCPETTLSEGFLRTVKSFMPMP